MGIKETYEQNTEVEVELAQAQVTELKVRAEVSTAEECCKCTEQVGELEQKIDATKEKLKELGEASEDAWEYLKDGVDTTCKTLRYAVRDTRRHETY